MDQFINAKMDIKKSFADYISKIFLLVRLRKKDLIVLNYYKYCYKFVKNFIEFNRNDNICTIYS